MHFFQRPDRDHVAYEQDRTRLHGTGGSFEVGRAGVGRWRFSEEVSWQSPGLDFGDAGFMRTPSDRINLESVVKYVVTEETRRFRSYSIGFDHSVEWDFGGDVNSLFGRLQGDAQLRNYWRVSGSVMRAGLLLDRQLLRGGPSVRVPGFWNVGGSVQTDTRPRFSARLFGNAQWNERNDTGQFSLSPSLDWRASRTLSFSIGVAHEWNRDDLQFVARVPVSENERFVLGTIRQRTASLTFRANYSLRPNLVIQYYGQPFVSSGTHQDFKAVADPRTSRYDDRFALLQPAVETSENGSRRLAVDENGDGEFDYRFAHPDFTFREFRSNLVLRWEYRPGSNLYLVWSQMRTGGSGDGNFHLTRDFRRIYEIYPHNVFAVKLSYWIGR